MKDKLTGLMVLAAFAYVAWSSMGVPIVQFSHTTGKCVEVFSRNPLHSCEDIPNPHYREIVK